MKKIIIYLSITTLFLNGCINKKSPKIDKKKNELPSNIINTNQNDSLKIFNNEQFYELETSIADIKKEIEILQTKVMEYQHKAPEDNYSKKLKQLIDKPYAKHKISLTNGSVIEGTIENDKPFSLLVNTDLGKITINKSDISKIDNLVLPIANVVFIGHGQEEILENYRIYNGKIMNQGDRRADFVRVIYYLWDQNTELIISDSSFVDGPQIVYNSGIVTDTILEPNQSVTFNLKIEIPDSIKVEYITRNINWEIFN
tara:strand:- start:763 stop:1533 length:771 start_codon:yes stop_codon:yes gene_type:complete